MELPPIGFSKEDGPFDVVIVSGDAYADHPAFGPAVIARTLQSEGYSVGIIDQPDWRKTEEFARLGRPNLFFGITAGNMDSMVANYSVFKNRREYDYFTPGGKTGRRPDRASVVYSHAVRKAYRDVPIVLGGVEASLRRFAHYDYWEDSVRRSVLFDAKADCLIYGMGEKAVAEVARHYAGHGRDEPPRGIENTCISSKEVPEGFFEIPPFEEVREDKEAFARAFTGYHRHDRVAQKHGGKHLLQFPMGRMTREELDRTYALPFTRTHRHRERVPALDAVKWSITTHRGCFGECSFCAIYFHQGKHIVSRSEESVLEEVRALAAGKDFKGTIDDLGGPSANMYGMDCPTPCGGDCFSCPKLDRSHSRSVELLRAARSVPGVKHVFVSSGIRHDLALESRTYLREVVLHHVPGRMKIAPEHVHDDVLRLMGKPPSGVYEDFLQAVRDIDRSCRVLPYFMAAHPGCSVNEMEAVMRFVKEHGEYEQCQVFTPTPMTLSTCMYHTGKNPLTGEKVYVPVTFKEKKLQKAMLLPSKPGSRKRLKRNFDSRRSTSRKSRTRPKSDESRSG